MSCVKNSLVLSTNFKVLSFRVQFDLLFAPTHKFTIHFPPYYYKEQHQKIIEAPLIMLFH